MLKNRMAVSFFGLSLILILLSAVIFALGLEGAKGDLILSFDYDGNIKWSGNFMTLGVIWAIAFIVVLINFLIANEIYNRDRFFSYLLGAGSIFFSSLFLIFSWLVVSIN